MIHSLKGKTGILFFILNFYVFLAFAYADLASDTLYLTWQKNPETTQIIQWVSLADDQDNRLYYRVKGDENWQQIIGTTFKFSPASRYFLHRVQLENLKPDTSYQIQRPVSLQIFNFRTLPSTLDESLRFVVGGDMYHDGADILIETCQQAAKVNPSFALLGGDIAYAVGSKHLPLQSMDRWIEWLKIWHRYMVTSDGYLIPVLTAVGNHDVIGHFDQTLHQAKVFTLLFPLHEKRLFNAFDFGSYLSVFFLDSGHTNPISGKQTERLSEAIQARQNIPHRFAIYHVPAYPSIRSFYNQHSSAIRRSWVPLFENKGIQVAFEHHDHAYKRTFPLIKNKMHPKGVVYLGDGAWGIEKPRKFRRRKPSYLAKFASQRHFITVTLYPTQQHFLTRDYRGQVIDEYVNSQVFSRENRLLESPIP